MKNQTSNFSELFLSFAESVAKCKQNLDYSKILLNLKFTITSFPPIDEIIEIYQSNFVNKSSPLKPTKKKWKFEENLVFVWIMSSFILMNRKSIERLSAEDWTYLSSLLPCLTAERCKFRWKSMQKSIVQTSEWDEEEDKLLFNIIQNKNKFKDSYKWTEIAHELNQKSSLDLVRLGKHCRERWYNHLDPNMKKGEWSEEEDIYIIESVLNSGKKWAKISKAIEGRTENAVKNRFITLVRQYYRMSGQKRKKDKRGSPLEVPIEVLREILNQKSRSPNLPDSPLKKNKNNREEILTEVRSPLSPFSDEIDEEYSDDMEHENEQPGNFNSPIQNYVEKQLIRLQEVKNDSCISIEENRKNFESADSDFKRILKQKLQDSPKIMNSGISPINLLHSNDSIHHLDSHFDISPNFQLVSKISEKSQEDMPSMEFNEVQKSPKKKKSELNHSLSTPLDENNFSLMQWERFLQNFTNNTSSKNLDNSSSFQILKTLNSMNSGLSKLSLENHLVGTAFDINFNSKKDENMIEIFKNLVNAANSNPSNTNPNLNSPENLFNNMSADFKKNEGSPIIKSFNNLNLSDSPKLFFPHDPIKNNSNFANQSNTRINKSISLDCYNTENLLSKKDSCSNFLNLEKSNNEVLGGNSNSLLKNMEEINNKNFI